MSFTLAWPLWLAVGFFGIAAILWAERAWKLWSTEAPAGKAFSKALMNACVLALVPIALCLLGTRYLTTAGIEKFGFSSRFLTEALGVIVLLCYYLPLTMPW
jgi:hypothetical protein